MPESVQVTTPQTHQHWRLSRTDFRKVAFTDKSGSASVDVAQIEAYDCTEPHEPMK